MVSGIDAEQPNSATFQGRTVFSGVLRPLKSTEPLWSRLPTADGASYRDIKTVWILHGDFSFQTRYNIAPSQEVPVIIRNDALMKWGLVLSRAPDPSMSQRMIKTSASERPNASSSSPKKRSSMRNWKNASKHWKLDSCSKQEPVDECTRTAIRTTRTAHDS
jgi:hypothetical protein